MAGIIIQVDAILSETADAYLLDCEGDAVWLPKSQIELDMEQNQVEIPEWLFKRTFPDG